MHPSDRTELILNHEALARLAACTARSPESLRHALPSLRSKIDNCAGKPSLSVITYPASDKPVPACPQCAARSGIHVPVIVHLPRHAHICVAHRIWLRGPLTDVSAIPEYVVSQQLHDILAKSRSSVRLLEAGSAATDVLIAWISRQHFLHNRWNQRQEKLSTERRLPSTLLYYPEYVVLLELLATDRSRDLAFGTRSERQRFARLAQDRLSVPIFTRGEGHASPAARSAIAELLQIQKPFG